MKNALMIATAAMVLSACTSLPELAPIPGSITYGGQPKTALVKAPVGSTVKHRLNDQYGNPSEETYVVEAGGTLRLVRRELVSDKS
ncbi:hypothetical protein [Pararhizobium gei]|uniref:hypothetical protein n=1 Tax=Pararhizobium gei TaxID=1395951 RepID=UPI0023DAE0D4|nr:hypothetical protein [Rhizobium gei]